MGLSVAVAGKGGTGKTTFSALLVRALVEGGVRPVLAVDADPNSCLAEALGVETETVLADLREKGASPEGSPPSGAGRVRAIEDDLQRAVTEADGFDMVTMGRPEGPRCYCYVNSLLRKSLDSLARNYAAVVLDNEAGMEHLSRRTTNNIDVLVAVANPALPSLRAAKRVLELSRELPVSIGRRAVLLSRAAPGAPAGKVAALLDELSAAREVERLPDIPQDDALERAGAEGRSVFELGAEAPALGAVRRIVEALRSGVANPSE
ncbi:MAG: nucleotide-binding protein [Planctomycetota bacterium]|jgi:CO dehydrogenase maturation factor